jgi:hypothetical protein
VLCIAVVDVEVDAVAGFKGTIIPTVRLELYQSRHDMDPSLGAYLVAVLAAFAAPTALAEAATLVALAAIATLSILPTFATLAALAALDTWVLPPCPLPFPFPFL